MLVKIKLIHSSRDPFISHSSFQNETHLCKRFTRFVMKYNLMSRDNLIVPILEEEDGEGEGYMINNEANEEFGDESYS